MALFNFGHGGGLFGGMFPELGGSNGYERLPPEAEAQLAQEARDAAALINGKKGARGTADMSLFTEAGPETLTAQMLRLNPFVGPQLAGAQTAQIPQTASAPASMPQVPQDGTIAGVGPWMQPHQPSNMNAPLSLAPPNPGANYTPTPVFAQPQQQPPLTDIFARSRTPQPQTMPQPATPDFGDRFGASMQSLFNSPSLISGIGNAMQSLQTGQRTDPRGQAQANQTQTAKAIFEGLVANGQTPQQAYGIAVAAAGNPEIAKAILPQALGPKEPPKTMEEYIARKAYENDRRPTGATNAPANVTQNYLDYLASKKAAETRGEKQGANQATLPTALMNSDMTIKHIDELLAHPGFDRLFGITGMFPSVPGGQAASADARMKQVTGEAFLSGFDMLRGGGAITEIEGKKATEAKARFDRAQSADEARVALKDFRDAVVQGRAKLQEQAGQPVTAAPPKTIQIAPGVTMREKR